MKLNTNPKRVLRNLDIRYIKENKLLNLFMILSVIFTCILFTNIFTIMMSINGSMQEKMFREIGSKDSGSFDYLTLDEMNVLATDMRIISSSYVAAGGSVENEELNKKFTTNIFYFSEDHYEKYKENNLSISEGQYPISEDEAMVSLAVLKELNVSPQIGNKIEIEYRFRDTVQKKVFIISGYFDYENQRDQQIIMISDEFIKGASYQGERIYSLFVNLKNNRNLGEKLYHIFYDSGLIGDTESGATFSINPAYSKYSFIDPGVIVAIAIIAGIIMISGYLMIYNIFHISIINNIRFYGLLKNVGFTSRQIRFFILKQGIYLTTCSLLPGLVIGYAIGYKILPILGGLMNIELKVQFHFLIFILAALFVILTVFISLQAPARYANKVSAAEALKTSGVGRSKGSKNIDRIISILTLSLINVLRNKKKFYVLLLSLSLMPVLFNSIYTFVSGFDYNNYIRNFVATDFVAAHYKYFAYKYDRNSTIDDKFIEMINENELTDAGIIYCNKEIGRNYSEDGFERISEEIYTTIYNGKDYDILMYGLDEFPLSKFEAIHGELNQELLATGDYIIEVLELDDFGNPDYSSMRFSVGDILDIKFNNKEVKSYTVLAQVKEISSFSDLSGTLEFIASLALPSEEYLRIAEKPYKMSYVFNVDSENLYKMEEKMNEYIMNEDNNMQFKSILSYDKEFEEAKMSFFLPGVFISCIIGFIGVMNFANVLVTDIISRKKELKILNNLGMTKKQMRNMFVLEGLLYTLFCTVFFLMIGYCFDTIIVKYIMDNIWFVQYQTSMVVLFAVIPVYAICAIIVTNIMGRVALSLA